MGKAKTFLIGCIVGSGGILFGYDQGIIGSTIAQPTFVDYFNNPTPSAQGGIVSSFSGGAFFGAIAAGYLADKISRKRTCMVGALLALIGSAIQTGGVNIGMLIAGRLIAGLGLGVLTMVIPMYNAEIAHPSVRGLLAGMLQQMLSFGFVIANWIGYGASFLSGEKAWRLGLGLQIVWAALLFAGLFLVPYSPRWLLMQNRPEDAKASLRRLHYDGSNDEWLEAEFREMSDQIALENTQPKARLPDLWQTRPVLKRTLLAVGIQAMTQMTGINVINYYGPQMYAALGYSDHDKLLINGLYGIIGPIVCAFALLFLVDRVGRKTPLLVGSFLCAVAMAAEAAIQKEYPATRADGAAAHKAGVGMIAVFSVAFSFSFGPISWIYSSELWSTRTRALGISTATAANWAFNVLFGQTGSLGLTNLGWSYYLAFVAFNVFNFVVILVFYPETKGRSLEAIAELFGDYDAAPRKGVSYDESANKKLDEEFHN